MTKELVIRKIENTKYYVLRFLSQTLDNYSINSKNIPSAQQSEGADTLSWTPLLYAGIPLTYYYRIYGPQSAVQSDEIWSDWVGPIVSIPLPDSRSEGRTKFTSYNELPLIVWPCLTRQTTADHPWLLLFSHKFYIRFFIRPSEPPIHRATGRRVNRYPSKIAVHDVQPSGLAPHSQLRENLVKI